MTNDSTTKQPSDIPSEEEIFDYFLGRSAPELSRRVAHYLKAHPQKARELRDFTLIESEFKDLPLTLPNELVLNRVRNMARKQLPRKGAIGWLAGLKTRFSTREMALVMTLIVAVVVSQVARQSQFAKTSKQTATINANTVVDKPSSAMLASRSESVSGSAILPESMTTADQVILALNNFDDAVALYQNGQLQEASHSFSHIMSQRPSFEKRRELYTYWVDSLKKLGKYGLAEKKQKILEDIIAEESKTH